MVETVNKELLIREDSEKDTRCRGVHGRSGELGFLTGSTVHFL